MKDNNSRFVWGVDDINIEDPIHKGDLPGHPFHGNQYENGEAGDAEMHERAQHISEALGFGKSPKFAENLAKIAAYRNNFGKYGDVSGMGKNSLKVANLIFDAIGNNNPPAVVPQSDFEEMPATKYFTGVADHNSPAQDKIADFAYGEGIKLGAGAYGRAWYATNSRKEAADYATREDNQTGGVIALKMKPESTVIDYDKAHQQLPQGQGNVTDELTQLLAGKNKGAETISRLIAQSIVSGDENIRFALSGVDALITHPYYDEMAYLMVLNRSNLVVSDHYQGVSVATTGTKQYTDIQVPPSPASVIKGDVEGHPFHGNQWTEGITSANITNPTVREITQKVTDFIRGVIPDTMEAMLAQAGNLKESVAIDIASRIPDEMNSRILKTTTQPFYEMGKRSPDSPLTQLALFDPTDKMGPNDRWAYDGSRTTYLGNTSNPDDLEWRKGVFAGDKTESITKPTYDGDTYQVLTGDEAMRQVKIEWASQMVASWAASSTSNQISQIIQEAAKDVFGLPENHLLSASHDYWGPKESFDEDTYAENANLYKAFVKAQYDATQEMFAKAGITEVPVYRGMAWSTDDAPEWVKDGDSAPTITTNPLSSFSYDKKIAQEFAEGEASEYGDAYSTTISKVIPVSQIFSCARTGIGCFAEKELVVLGSTQQWNADTETHHADEVAKGDKPGHEFHGNQYVLGIGSVSAEYVEQQTKAITKAIEGKLDFANDLTNAKVGELKANVAADLASRIPSIYDDAIAADYQKYGKHDPSALSQDAADIKKEWCSQMVASWANSSTWGQNSVLLQRAALDEFHLKGTKDYLADSGLLFMNKDRYKASGGAIRAFLRAQYNATQEFLAKHNITEVPVYRGMVFPTYSDTPSWVRDGTPASINPLSAFSYEKFAAEAFSDYVPLNNPYNGRSCGVVMSGIVPASRILSCAQTGLGCAIERELVVLGGADTWTTTNHDNEE
jgi:hypothetical protein